MHFQWCEQPLGATVSHIDREKVVPSTYDILTLYRTSSLCGGRELITSRGRSSANRLNRSRSDRIEARSSLFPAPTTMNIDFFLEYTCRDGRRVNYTWRLFDGFDEIVSTKNGRAPPNGSDVLIIRRLEGTGDWRPGAATGHRARSKPTPRICR